MTSPAVPARRLSLDLFRGLTILAMVLVNTQGEGAAAWPWLVHADWFGFTLADLVFPSFLFAMGSALALTGRTQASAGAFWPPVLRRGVLLFGIGVLMYWFPFFERAADGSLAFVPFSHTRLMGVLQRTALAYVLAAAAARHLSLRGLALLCAGLLAGYWALLVLGVPGPAGLSKAGNLGQRIDLLLLGREHLFRWDEGFEPEGLLGTLPATVNVIAGFAATRWLTRWPVERVLRDFLWGGLLLAAAGLLLSPLVPLGKKLWTPSFVLLTVGLDLLLMAVFVELADRRGHGAGRALLQPFGLNPLAVYVFSELFVVVLGVIPVGGRSAWSFFCVDVVQHWLPGAAGAFVVGVLYTALCWALAQALYRRRIVIRV